MKLVHISDIHIDPEPILGLDPVDNFVACLDHVQTHHGDADRIVITGDLTHHGRPNSYERLRQILDDSTLVGDQTPRLLIGNHDDRDNFLDTFPAALTDEDGFIQWTEDTPVGVFVYMDTVVPGQHAGAYCARRRDWLEWVLERARAADRPAWLFMHHNPTAVHVADADRIGLREEAELKTLLSCYRDTVRHVFFGHCHYTLSGSVSGIPFSAPRSTNHACRPDFSGEPGRAGHGGLQPTYNVCFLDERDVVVHSIDFLAESRVTWTVADAGRLAEPAH